MVMIFIDSCQKFGLKYGKIHWQALHNKHGEGTQVISGVFISVHKTCKEIYFHTSKKRLQAMKNKWKRNQAGFFTVMLNKGGKGNVVNSTEAKYFGTILDMGNTC